MEERHRGSSAAPSHVPISLGGARRAVLPLPLGWGWGSLLGPPAAAQVPPRQLEGCAAAVPRSGRVPARSRGGGPPTPSRQRRRLPDLLNSEEQWGGGNQAGALCGGWRHTEPSSGSRWPTPWGRQEGAAAWNSPPLFLPPPPRRCHSSLLTDKPSHARPPTRLPGESSAALHGLSPLRRGS